MNTSKAPDKIYARITAGDLDARLTPGTMFGEPYPEYIRKDLLLEWAQEQYEFYKRVDADFSGTVFVGNRQAFAEMINKLNSL